MVANSALASGLACRRACRGCRLLMHFFCVSTVGAVSSRPPPPCSFNRYRVSGPPSSPVITSPTDGADDLAPDGAGAEPRRGYPDEARPCPAVTAECNLDVKPYYATAPENAHLWMQLLEIVRAAPLGVTCIAGRQAWPKRLALQPRRNGEAKLAICLAKLKKPTPSITRLLESARGYLNSRYYRPTVLI